MKKFLFFLSISALFSVISCNDDDAPKDELDYGVHFHSPDTSDKHIGDNLEIEVEFHEHNGGTVHHVHVKLYNKTTGQVIYEGPASAHVHKTDKFVYEHSLVLDATNSVTEHSDWILVGTVWGEEDGEGLVRDSIGFHVHP